MAEGSNCFRETRKMLMSGNVRSRCTFCTGNLRSQGLARNTVVRIVTKSLGHCMQTDHFSC